VPDLRDDFRDLPNVSPVWVRPAVVVPIGYRQRLRHAISSGGLWAKSLLRQRTS